MDAKEDTKAADANPLEQGVAAAKAGNKLLARIHLEEAIELEPENPACWLWLAWTADSPASALASLEHTLSIAPDHGLAQWGLHWTRALKDFDIHANHSVFDSVKSEEHEEGDTIDEDGSAIHLDVSTPDDDLSLADDVDPIAGDGVETITDEVATIDEDVIEGVEETEDDFVSDQDHLELEEVSGEGFEEISIEDLEVTPIDEHGAATDEELIDEYGATTDEALTLGELDGVVIDQDVDWSAEDLSAPDEDSGWTDDGEVSGEDEASDGETSVDPTVEAEYGHSLEDAIPTDVGFTESDEELTEGITEAIPEEFNPEFNQLTEETEEIEASPVEGEELASRDTVIMDDILPSSEDDDELADTDHGNEHSEAADSVESTTGEVDDIVELTPTSSETDELVEPTLVDEDSSGLDEAGGDVSTEELEQEANSHDSATSAKAAEQPTILAVDDSPTVRKLVAMTLEKSGYTVITAPDGTRALDIIATCKPGLILLDTNMPRLNGYQLCKLIKKHKRTEDIPVIMISGKDGVFDKLRGTMVGCNDYITKPFESTDLVQKVAAYLPATAVTS